MKPAISILIPHLREPVNNEALRICLDCIAANTGVDYELIVESVSTRRGIYGVCNQMAARAAADWIVFSNTDVFFAPGWAEPMLAAAERNTIITNVIVECGAIGVNTANVHWNFGMTPQTFNRTAFEHWCTNTPHVPPGNGFYFPSLHHRETFLDFGGFDVSEYEFPEPLDKWFWEQWIASGRSVQRVASFCYHLQNFSNPAEQTKAVRHAY